MACTVYIGLGSNLEEPIGQVRQALTEINAMAGCRLINASSLYHSVAIGPAQPDYINCVASIATTLEPLALLDGLQAIEQSHKRVRLEHWGPRTLDLDILLWGNTVINIERLKVPHPYLQERNFVLLPLHEIAPHLILPCQTPLARLANLCSQQGIERIKDA